MKSKFIVIEGLEGAGKTTTNEIVISVLKEHGINECITIRDPGGTVIGEQLRLLIKHDINGEKLNDKAELLMLYASRIQLIENVIKPALKRGAWVISDRFDLSSQAYQGGGRGLDPILINTLRHSILENFQPDLTLYLDIIPEIGLQRAKERCDKLDRIEKESLGFFERTRKHYLKFVSGDPKIIMIDASQNLNEMTLSIKVALYNWLADQH